MGELAILVPVLKRPQNVVPLLESVENSTPDARVVFICDAFDIEEIETVDQAGGERLIVTGNYARKINRGIHNTKEPLIFLGADDLRFRPGWFERAKAKLDPAEVVGINDMIRRHRKHTTHFLITRSYTRRGLIDGRRGVLCEDYQHSCVDDELIATATKRGLYTYAPNAKVEHLHPMSGKAPVDATYKWGTATIRPDRRLLREREHLWT